MRRYLNTDTLELQERPDFASAIDQLSARRGDTPDLDIYFVTSGVVVDKGGAIAITFTAKPSTGDQRFDQVNVIRDVVFTRMVDDDDEVFYRANPSTSNAYIDKLLGVDPVDAKEVCTVATIADVSASLGGKYFTLFDNVGEVRVWIDVANGSTAPAAPTSGRLIEVDIASGATASAVASAISTKLDADAKFAATVSTNTVTVTDASAGPRANAGPGNSGFTVTVTAAGSSALTVVDEDEVELNAVISWLDGTARSTSRRFSLVIENNPDREDNDEQTVIIGFGVVFPILNYSAVAGRTGGGPTKLDGIPTANGALPLGHLAAIAVDATEGLEHWRLKAGTTAESEATGIVRPDDYDAVDNACYWQRES